MKLWNLTLRGEDGRLRLYVLGEGAYVVGTDLSCEIMVPVGEGVEERHARIYLSGAGSALEDLGSVSGTLLEERRIEGRTELPEVTTVRMGRVDLLITPGEPGNLSGNLSGSSEGDGDLAGESSTKEKSLEGFHLEMVEAGTLESVPVQMSYKLNGVIARGGMGTIFSAQDPLLEREVVVKLSSAVPTRDGVPFDTEAKRLALLEHPNIVPIYAMGVTEGGQPFYSMKLVKGTTLQEVLDKLAAGDPWMLSRYTRDGLLLVFRKLCDAVAFAHSKGILHRDIKPANVMLGEYGEVLLMDWGIAQEIRKSGYGVEFRERTGDAGGGGDVKRQYVEGTPQYMSPEQASGEVLDERSDIYALGGVLYAMLSLRGPVQGGSLVEVLSKVKRGETELRMGIGGGDAQLAGLLEERVPKALRAVILTAMALDRHDRYPRVAQLIRDMESYQNGFATFAEDAGVGRLLVLMVQRHKVAAAFLSLLIFATLLFVVEITASKRRALDNAQIAEVNKLAAQQNARLAERKAREAEENAIEAKANAGIALANEQRALVEKEALRRAVAMAQLSVADNAVPELDGEALERALQAVPVDLREETWEYLRRKIDTALLEIKVPGPGWIATMVPYPLKAGIFVSLKSDGWVRFVDVNTGKVENLFQHRYDKHSSYMRMAVSPDGERIAIASQTRSNDAGADAELKYWEVAPVSIYRVSDGVKILEISREVPSEQLEFSPDGKYLLGRSPLVPGSRFQVWELETGKLRWSGGDGLDKVQAFSGFAAHGGGLVVLSRNGQGTELDLESGAVRRELFKRPVFVEKAFIDSKQTVLYRSGRGLFQKWDLNNGEILFERSLMGKGLASPYGMDYLPGAGVSVMVSVRSPRCDVVQVWDDQSGALRQSLIAMHESSGNRVLLGHPLSDDVVIYERPSSTVKVWKVGGAKPVRQVWADGNRPIAFLGEPWLFARYGFSGIGVRGSYEIIDLRRKDDSSAQLFRIRNDEASGLSNIQTSFDARILAASDRKKRLMVVRRDGSKFSDVANWEASGPIGSFCLDPSGERVWTRNGLHKTLTGELVCPASSREDVDESVPSTTRWVGQNRIAELCFLKKRTPEDRQGGNTLLLWDAETGARLRAECSPLANRISVSPDGKYIAEGGNRLDKKIRIRNADNLELVKEFRAHDGAVIGVEWHPNLPLLVSASDDLTIKVWSTGDWRLVEEIGGVSNQPDQLILSPDGLQLAVHHQYGNQAYFWEPASFRGELR